MGVFLAVRIAMLFGSSSGGRQFPGCQSPGCTTYPDLHPCTLGVILLISTGAFLLLGALFPLPELLDHMRFAETLCKTTSTGIADRMCCEARDAVCTSQRCGAFDCADALQRFEDDRYLPNLRNQSYAFPHSCCGEHCCVHEHCDTCTRTTCSRRRLQGAGGGGGGSSSHVRTCTTEEYDCNCVCLEWGEQRFDFDCAQCFTARAQVSYVSTPAATAAASASADVGTVEEDFGRNGEAARDFVTKHTTGALEACWYLKDDTRVARFKLDWTPTRWLLPLPALLGLLISAAHVLLVAARAAPQRFLLLRTPPSAQAVVAPSAAVLKVALLFALALAPWLLLLGAPPKLGPMARAAALAAAALLLGGAVPCAAWGLWGDSHGRAARPKMLMPLLCVTAVPVAALVVPALSWLLLEEEQQQQHRGGGGSGWPPPLLLLLAEAANRPDVAAAGALVWSLGLYALALLPLRESRLRRIRDRRRSFSAPSDLMAPLLAPSVEEQHRMLRDARFAHSHRCCCVSTATGAQPPMTTATAAAAAAAASAAALPPPELAAHAGARRAAKWQGVYWQYGRRDDFELSLLVHANGAVEGEGSDRVGVFYVRGCFRPPARGGGAEPRATLLKYYVRGTGDPNENYGHLVRYVGVLRETPAYSIDGDRTQPAEHDVYGEWHVDVLCGYRATGAFRLWPAPQQQAIVNESAVGIPVVEGVPVWVPMGLPMA